MLRHVRGRNATPPNPPTRGQEISRTPIPFSAQNHLKIPPSWHLFSTPRTHASKNKGGIQRAQKQPRKKQAGRRVGAARTLPPKEMRSTSMDTTEPPESPIPGAAPARRRRRERLAGRGYSGRPGPSSRLPINRLVRAFSLYPTFLACLGVAYKRRKGGRRSRRTASLSSASPSLSPLFSSSSLWGRRTFAALYFTSPTLYFPVIAVQPPGLL